MLALLLLGCGAAPECHERVIFVVVDALRRDHLSITGYAKATSPRIDALAREGLFLANVVAASSHTVPSTLSILTSLLPSEHGLHYSARQRSLAGGPGAAPVVPEHVTLLSERFARAGFYTAGVVANPWLSERHGFARGFDDYTLLASRDGADINALAKKLLSDHRDERAFLYLHYLDVHNPYLGPSRDPAPFARPESGRYRYLNGPAPDLAPEDLAYTQALYDERIFYMDGHLAELGAFLAKEKLDCDTTWVVTTDHGDEFMEHGGLGHGTTLFNELVAGFAVFWNPTRFAPRRVDHYVQALDLGPTLLAAHGLPEPEGTRGRSLYAARGAEPPAYPVTDFVSELADERAVVRGDWKLIVGGESGGEALYRVGGGGAIETRARAADDGEVAAALRQVLDAFPGGGTGSPPPPVPLDPDTRERLRELGYERLGDESEDLE